MRHLINTYIKADDAEKLGEIDDFSLVDLIVKTGIHDAIAQKLNAKGTLSRNAVAEGIINNVRKTIIRDQLTDPRFYEEMSKLLADLLQQKRDNAEDYEAFLKNTEALVQKMAQGRNTDNVPDELKGNREAILIYALLPSILAKTQQLSAVAEPEAPYGNEILRLTIAIDRALRTEAPADWRGDEAREKQVQNVLFRVLKKDREATLALFTELKQMAIY
jgi:type I restriction enzyme R subunit